METFSKRFVKFDNSDDYVPGTNKLDVDDNTTQYSSDAINVKHAKDGALALFVNLDGATAAKRAVEIGYLISHDGVTFIQPEGHTIYKNLKDPLNVADAAIEFSIPPCEQIKITVKGDSANTDTNFKGNVGFYEKL